MDWPNYAQPVIPKQEEEEEEYEDFLTFPAQFPPLNHHHHHHLSAYCGYTSPWDHDFQPELCYFHPACLDMFVSDPFLTALDYAPIQSYPIPEGFVFDSGIDDCFGIRNEKSESFGAELESGRISSNNGKTMSRVEKAPEMVDSNLKKLSRETISEYFYMPIMQAAKELNVGLTLLKKRCRELGIRRWPHRKLMSLQTLITNVQEMGNEEGGGKREAIGILEQQKKLIVEVPDMELKDETKRLRQQCFKANYKKRRLMMGMNVSSECASNNN